MPSTLLYVPVRSKPYDSPLVCIRMCLIVMVRSHGTVDDAYGSPSPSLYTFMFCFFHAGPRYRWSGSVSRKRPSSYICMHATLTIGFVIE
jgi:hypothetical protein